MHKLTVLACVTTIEIVASGIGSKTAYMYSGFPSLKDDEVYYVCTKLIYLFRYHELNRK
jgi:hypothetical protein